MLSFNDKLKAKYKVLLVAYKDLPNEVEKDLNYHFISKINNSDDLRDHDSSGDYRTSAGLDYRTCIYHSWFKDSILKKLNEGYFLGIVEMRKASYDRKENVIKKMEETHTDKILIVDEAEL